MRFVTPDSAQSTHSPGVAAILLLFWHNMFDINRAEFVIAHYQKKWYYHFELFYDIGNRTALEA